MLAACNHKSLGVGQILWTLKLSQEVIVHLLAAVIMANTNANNHQFAAAAVVVRSSRIGSIISKCSLRRMDSDALSVMERSTATNNVTFT